MPRINLKDQDPQPPPSPDDPMSGAPPSPEGFGEEPSKKTPWLIFAALVVVAALAVVFLNQKNIIHLWGKRTPRVVEALPEPAPVTPNDSAAMAVSAPGGKAPGETPKSPESSAPKPSTPAVKPAPEKSTPPVHQNVQPSAPVATTPSGSGDYAVQLSSWPGRGRADAIVTELTGKGFHAYVAEGAVNGATWYRVRVGNFGTSKEAAGVVTSLEQQGFAGGIVVKAGK